MGPTFLYGDSDTPPHLVAFYDHAGDTEVHILDLTPRALTGGLTSVFHKTILNLFIRF